MLESHLAWVIAAATLAIIAGFGGWMASLPTSGDAAKAPPVPQSEVASMLASLRPRREHPVVAIMGVNDGTETLDYLMPAGILRRSGVADVILLGTGPGPMKLFPALSVQPDATIAEFDASYPDGADYVVVPAMSRDNDRAALAWLKHQAQKGAVLIGVCAGAKVVASTGLLDGKRATTHWYYLKAMLRRNPTIRYVADRRMVADGKVVTTTGITASMPMMLTLIEAIAGRAKAEEVASDLGLIRWDARHASRAFKFTRHFAATVLLNSLAFWRREEFGIRLEPGMEEISLALVADAWSRTYRSRAKTYAISPDVVESRNGIRIFPDQIQRKPSQKTSPATIISEKPANALDQTLGAIAARYGMATTTVVSMQLEYPQEA